MKAVRTIFLLICFCVSIPALSQTVKTVVLFESGKSNISAEYQRQLRDFATGLKDQKDYLVEIGGHTDNTGNKELNQELSEERAKAVHEFLINAGADRLAFSVEAYGAERPVSDNTTAAGKRMNRRVEVTVILNSGETSTTNTEDISDLYRQLEIPMQEFCIDPRRDTVIRCKEGTVIYIPANSLVAKNGCNLACINFRVKEVFRRSEMIFDNLSTTSNGDIIESQGMIYTEARDCEGNEVSIQKGKDMVVVIPTDTVRAADKIFTGIRGHDSVMNWVVNNNSELSNFTLDDLNTCGGLLCGRGPVMVCDACPFFFCRIGRIGKVVKGIFSKKAREENQAFRQCVQNTVAVQSGPRRTPVDRIYPPRCGDLAALFKKYNVQSVEALILALNKPLLDSFKVNTIEELEDTMRKLTKRKIELSYVDQKISFEDFKYYIYNTSTLGWANVDCFANFPKSQLVTMRVDLPISPNVDCKLVFRGMRAVIPATRVGDQYEFRGVPRGRRAYVVALKYEEGKPFLHLKEVEVAAKTFEVEFKQLTLEELKQELKKLDE